MTNPDPSGLMKLFPLSYEDGPDYCTVKDVEGDSFALTAYPEIMKEMESALRRLASSDGGVKVRELNWSQSPPPAHEHEPFVYWAAGLGGHYKAERDGLLWMAHDGFVWEQHPTQNTAKAAAQADYEARIKSALVEVPAVKGEPEPVAWPTNLNPRTLDLVQRFALALAKKLRLAEEKHDHTDEWSRDDWEFECRDHLYQHLEKGDPRDVAAYCAFMWYHGWITYRAAKPASPADAGMREAVRRLEELDCLYVNGERYPFGGIVGDPETAIRREAIKECIEALTPPGATTKSDGGCSGSLPSGESEPVVTPAWSPSDPSPTRSEVTVEECARQCADDLVQIIEVATKVAKRTGNTFVMDRQKVATMIAGHFAPLLGQFEIRRK